MATKTTLQYTCSRFEVAAADRDRPLKAVIHPACYMRMKLQSDYTTTNVKYVILADRTCRVSKYVPLVIFIENIITLDHYLFYALYLMSWSLFIAIFMFYVLGKINAGVEFHSHFHP